MSTAELPLAGLRFIVAARQSKKLKAGENFEFPIEVQDARAKGWAEAQGGEYIGTAADFRSGTVAPWDRKNLRAWVNETGDKIRSYDAVVATEITRISRGDDEDFSTIEAWAVRNKKKLIIVGPDGGIQYPARHDSDFWQWTATKHQARKEWESIRQRSMNRQADLRARGKLSGGAIPFGYDVDGKEFDKTLKPNDLGKLWVPQIFERVKSGKWSLDGIARWLDSEGVKPVTWQAWNKVDPDKRGPEPKWSPKSIAQMIRNQTYVGQRRADEIINGKRLRGQGVIRIEVKELVDSTLWLAANKALDNAPRRGRRGPKNWDEPALLAGVLRCGNCGAPMYRLKVRGGYVYYRCHGHLPKPRGCGVLVATSLLDSEVDKMMLASELWVYDWILHPGEEAQIQAEIDKIRLQLMGLATKGLSEEYEDAERASLRAQRRELEAQLKDAKSERWEKTLVMKDGKPLTEAKRWEAADPAGKREILKEWRITFNWIKVDGQREPIVTMAPLWADAGKDDQS
jgi:DNA invertase Pin-like site-specific DNA recombinase